MLLPLVLRQKPLCEFFLTSSRLSFLPCSTLARAGQLPLESGSALVTVVPAGACSSATQPNASWATGGVPMFLVILREQPHPPSSRRHFGHQWEISHLDIGRCSYNPFWQYLLWIHVLLKRSIEPKDKVAVPSGRLFGQHSDIFGSNYANLCPEH